MTNKKPTVKELKLVAAKAKGKKNDEAWDEAGYSQNSNKNTKVVNTSKILSKPHVQEALQVALKKHGITLDKAIAPIGEALDAEKVVIVGKGDDAFADVTPDHSVRLQASDRALKLMGVNNNETSGTTNYNFINVAKTDKDEFQL
jgi:hypothetical protein